MNAVKPVFCLTEESNTVIFEATLRYFVLLTRNLFMKRTCDVTGELVWFSLTG